MKIKNLHFSSYKKLFSLFKYGSIYNKNSLAEVKKAAVKAIALGIILTLIIECYYVFFISDITSFDIIVNVSLSIIVFMFCTAYLLFKLENAEHDLKEAYDLLKRMNRNLEEKVKDRTSEINKLLIAILIFGTEIRWGAHAEEIFAGSLPHSLKE